MKIMFILFFQALLFSITARSQHIEQIFVNLYTDSLKRGTYNYINIDGLLSNGKYLPLDSTHLTFSSSYGKFYGNSLYLDKACTLEKVSITVRMKNMPSLHKEFDIYVKKKED